MDNEDKELKQESQRITSRGRLITNRQQDKRRGGTEEFQEFGLCCDCSNLNATSTEVGKKHAECSAMNKKLSPSNPIKYCTNYYKFSFLTLKDMKEMAILIDPGGSRKIGFITNDEFDPWHCDGEE